MTSPLAVCSETDRPRLPVNLPKPPSLRRKASTSSSKVSAPVITTASEIVSFDTQSNETRVSAPTLDPSTNDFAQSLHFPGTETAPAVLPGVEPSDTTTQKGTTRSTDSSTTAEATFFQDLLGVSLLPSLDTSTATIPLDNTLPMSFDLFAEEEPSFFNMFLNEEMIGSQGDAFGFDNSEADVSKDAPSPMDEQRTSRAPSSESEGSNLLDPTFDLDTALLTGAAPPAYDIVGGGSDPTMSTTFGDKFGADQFTPEMIAMLLQPPFVAPAQSAPLAPVTISPGQLSTPLEGTPVSVTSDLPGPSAPSMKRKLSESSVDSHQQPKKRGRPPKNPASLGLTIQTPSTPKPKRQAAKPSVAKPKAVVPQKYLRDGSAQAALGMTESQILAYPDFDALLLAVAPALKERAAAFGEHIEYGRRQAAESAQSNRAAKDAKLNALADEVQRLKDGFRELYNKGLIDGETLSRFVAE